VDSSSGSEAGESPGRSIDSLPPDIPQLDGTEDSDYESCGELPDSEDAPVQCEKCRCTYRTPKSYERHLESQCHELLLSSSEDEEDSPPSPDPSPTKPPARTYSRKKCASVAVTPQVTTVLPTPIQVISLKILFQQVIASMHIPAQPS